MPILTSTESPVIPRRKGWKTAGWQGLTLQTPPEWNLVSYGGDSKTGNLRLDNADESVGRALGMEMRWSSIKGKVTDETLEKRLTDYFRSIEKGAKRQKLVADAKSKIVSDEKRPERTATRAFTWKADRKAVGRIWHCGKCGRLVIAQVLGDPRGEIAGTAGDILGSIECHPENGEWRVWSLYDLLTQIPADYTLRGQPQLMNIYVQLAFQRGQSTDILTVEQWGVANVQVRGAYLDEWFRRKNAAQEALLRYDAEETTAQGHPALLLTGRRAGFNYGVSQVLPQLVKLQKPATHFAACVWECPESNKIHLVQSYSRRPQPELIRDIVERTPCH